jgi:hypothetical protein
VHLQEPVSASHSRTVLSLLPEAMAFPSAEKATKLLQTVDRRQETPRAVPRPPQPPFGRSSSAFHSGRLTQEHIHNWSLLRASTLFHAGTEEKKKSILFSQLKKWYSLVFCQVPQLLYKLGVCYCVWQPRCAATPHHLKRQQYGRIGAHPTLPAYKVLPAQYPGSSAYTTPC